jgi:DnaJ-class molecular chaperone
VNPYEVLGVAPDASTADIKKAYRKLARETHPDLNPGDAVAETRFKQVSVAYDILGDEKKRADYDEFGEISLQAGFDADRARTERDQFSSRFGSPDPSSYGEGFAFGGLDDLFRQFGGGGRRSSPQQMQGGDIESSMTLGFVEAIQGGERRLSLARPGADGSVQEESIKVRIPPGVSSGGRLRIPGKGGLGLGGGPPGDLWISIRVEPHPIFRRDGRNLEFDLPITLDEAMRGAKVEIPTLGERATLTIPPATNSHTRLRLRGKGVPGAKGKPDGDLLACIRIILPKEAPDSLIEALEQCEQENPRKELFR